MELLNFHMFGAKPLPLGWRIVLALAPISDHSVLLLRCFFLQLALRLRKLSNQATLCPISSDIRKVHRYFPVTCQAVSQKKQTQFEARVRETR